MRGRSQSVEEIKLSLIKLCEKGTHPCNLHRNALRAFANGTKSTVYQIGARRGASLQPPNRRALKLRPIAVMPGKAHNEL